MRYDQAWKTATVTETEIVAEDVRSLLIAPEGGRASPYAPGSHLNVQVMVGGQPQTRHYSLVGEPHPEHYRVAVKKMPQSRGGSDYMCSLKPGGRLSIMGPNNLFSLDFDKPQYLLVAGGIGITPICGMALALARRDGDFRLHYCGRKRAGMAFLDLLEEHLGDRLTVHASDEGGRLDMSAAIDGLPPDGALYVCGPIGMLDAGRKAWEAAGRDRSLFRYETFGSSGTFAPQRFWVKVPQLGVELEVPETKSLLQALRESGVDVISDCERGECGLCVLSILELEGEVDHRDVFFSAEEKQENTKLCTCVSRVVGGGIVLDSGYRPD
jgi:vanillate O-demethylase ferredoxin subunit